MNYLASMAPNLAPLPKLEISNPEKKWILNHQTWRLVELLGGGDHAPRSCSIPWPTTAQECKVGEAWYIPPPNFCHAEFKKKRSTDFLSTDKICHKCSERNNKDEIHGETALAVDRTSEKAWCPLVPDFLPKKSQISAILGVLTPRLF